MDDNIKFSIQEYREALYKQLNLRKKEQRKEWQKKFTNQFEVVNNTKNKILQPKQNLT